MSDMRALYEQTVVDHSKNPRNFHALDNASAEADADNPLCGDRVRVYIRAEAGRIADVAFTGDGCAISKASASLMTCALNGMSLAQAQSLHIAFHRMLTSDDAENPHEDALADLEALRGVRAYPVRIKCAILPWRALSIALMQLEARERTD